MSLLKGHTAGLKIVLTFLVLAVLTQTGAAAGKVGADSGALVSTEHYCEDVGEYRSCFDFQTVYQAVETNSGNLNVAANGEVCITTISLATGEAVRQDCNRFNQHVLLKEDAVLHEEGAQIRTISTFDDTVCTSIGRLHYANGNLQFENNVFSCSSI